jgi:hypothetical protein
MEYLLFIVLSFVAGIMIQQSKQEKAIRRLDRKITALMGAQGLSEDDPIYTQVRELYFSGKIKEAQKLAKAELVDSKEFREFWENIREQ